MLTKTRIASHALLLLAASLLLATPGFGEDGTAEPSRDPKALEILEKTDAALKKVGAVAFESSIEPTGFATNFIQPGKAKGVMAGWTGQIPEKFHVLVELQQGETVAKIEGGGNGDTYFLVDHVTRKGYEDMDPGVLGSSAATLQSIAMVEYVHATPFDDEIGAQSMTYVGTTRVGDVSCHEINVVYGGGMGESTWYLGEDDYLPRRRVRHFQTPQGDGTIDIRMGSIEIDPELDGSRFLMKLPEGYEQVDDFAP